MRPYTWLIAALCGLSALPAVAQQPAAPPKISDYVSMREAEPDDIVVTARPTPSDIEVDRQARSISQVNGSILHEPLGRFRSRVCPGVIGLSVEMAELLVGRIRYNAERIGVPTADASVCRANIILNFSRDGKAEVESLARTQSHVFAELTTAEVKELLAETGPVRAWANTVTRSRHGDSIRGRKTLVDPPVLNVANSHSHIFLAHRLDIDSAVVMIDVAAIDGLTLDQIADYATMRAFARTRPPEANAPADTILTLFDPDAGAPRGLTGFDLAYLKSLYSTYDSARAITAIAATSRALREEPKSEVEP